MADGNVLQYCFFFSSRRRHTRYWRDWSSDVCSSDLNTLLHKVSSLSRQEFEQIKKHPTQGAMILNQQGIFKEVVPIVHCHHEHWNGYGYRSEERRVGKECRSGWSTYHSKKKKQG